MISMLQSRSGHYAGATENMAARKKDHKLKSGCTKMLPVLVCRNKDEAVRAEAILITKLVTHENLEIRLGVCNERGGGFSEIGISCRYFVYLLVDEDEINVPGSGADERHPLRTEIDIGRLEEIADNMYERLLAATLAAQKEAISTMQNRSFNMWMTP